MAAVSTLLSGSGRVPCGKKNYPSTVGDSVDRSKPSLSSDTSLMLIRNPKNKNKKKKKKKFTSIYLLNFASAKQN